MNVKDWLIFTVFVHFYSCTCSYVCMYVLHSKWLYVFNLFPLNVHREKPLAVYAFTSDSAEKEKITASTSSGGVVFNDIMVQFVGKCGS